MVLSVRVRKELKEEVERLGIDLRALSTGALEDEIRKRKAEVFKKQMSKALNAMSVTEEE